MHLREGPMVSAILFSAVLLGSEPGISSASVAPGDRVAYEQAKGEVGRDPDANVRLALWCEAHGLAAERVEHLARAVLSDPSHAVARGLLGMVTYGGRWSQPEEVAAKAQADEALQATLAEYNARREGMAETADSHFVLARWCEQKGLKPEAIAHYTAVTRLDPNNAEAWTRLGCRKVGGRWLSEAQIAAEKAETDAQRSADAKWGKRLRQWWKDWLADKERRPEAEETLGEELEPRAVPMIRTLFSRGTAEQQLVAVQMYDRIDAPAATRDLSRLATMDRDPEVLQSAIDALTRRDPKEVIEPLVSLMRVPMEVSVSLGRGRGAVSELRVEDEQAILRKFYVQKTERVLAPRGRFDAGFLAAVLPQKRERSAREQLGIDVRTVTARNDARRATNDSARMVLAEITGQDLGPQPESWRRWLADQQGYAYVRPSTPKRVITRISRHTNYQLVSVGFHHNCFAEGILVRTLLGPKPIETLRVGDQVLGADPATGALSYQPVVVVYHNPPSPTLRIKLEKDEIVATPIHRFWRVGKGWTLARELRPGDSLRVLGGVAKVAAIEADAVQPVFNLEVAQGHSYFVGPQGALVHDNSPLEPGSTPFDAAPAIAAVASRSR
jgi:hypothetical protein